MVIMMLALIVILRLIGKHARRHNDKAETRAMCEVLSGLSIEKWKDVVDDEMESMRINQL